LFALVCVVLLSRVAIAEAPPDDQKRQEAKRHFVKGLELVRAEEWDAALAEFYASREIFPTQVALKNAAICLGQLKRHAEAAEMYRELLSRFGASVSPEEKKSITDALADLATRVGKVVVTASPQGSTVVVDGRQRGKTPLSAAIELDAGTHRLRIWKAGYETFETDVVIAGNQSKSIVTELVALEAAGILVVTEIEGKRVDVVVDGVVVGPAPWTGTVAPGTHVVLLRGDGGIGTPPSAASVKNGGTTELRLRAALLDSVLRVEPFPANAQLFIDGVAVGNGIWEGRLNSGAHTVEAVAEGFRSHRAKVTTRAGKPALVRVTLERDLSNPMWAESFVPHVYLEALGGLAWAPSFGGGADAACSSGDGCDRSRPFGFLAGVRGGYALTRVVGLELFLGVLYLKGSTRRSLVAVGENGDWTSSDYEDETRMFGPAAAISASARFLEKTPLTFRVWAGVARMSARFENRGSFSGTVVVGPSATPIETASSTQETSVPEKSAQLWMPLFGPEVRFGYRLSKRLAVDAGVLLLFAFPGDTPRTGLTDVSSGDGDRKVAMRDVTLPSGNVGRGGLMTLPRENGFGTMMMVVPSLALRFDL
jgi:hypothetical protein